MNKYRIREISIDEDKTNVWFYPEICITWTDKRMFCKNKELEEWANLYGDPNTQNLFKSVHPFVTSQMDNEDKLKYKERIIAFRNLQNAREWFDNYISSLKIVCERDGKFKAIEYGIKEDNIYAIETNAK